MKRYSVILVGREFKEGDYIPFGRAKELLIGNVHNRGEAIAAAKRIAGNDWKVVSAVRSYGMLDPDAKGHQQ